MTSRDMCRFDTHWTLDIETGCWLWHGNLTFYTQQQPKQQLAHICIYEHTHGRIPDSFTVDHICRVRNCVNPLHLELNAPIAAKKPTKLQRLQQQRALSSNDNWEAYVIEARKRREASI